MLILLYGEAMWQKFVFQLPDLIPDTKNGVFRYYFILSFHFLYIEYLNEF